MRRATRAWFQGGLAAKGWIGTDAVLAVELGARDPLDPPEGYSVTDERAYGAARVVFLKYAG